MQAIHLSAALVLVALAVGAAASPAAPPTFPAKASDWHLEERRSYGRSDLFSFIDGGAEVYLAYGFRRLSLGIYRRAGSPEIAAEAYGMGLPHDAYGVLSLDLTGEAVPVGSLARYGAGLLRFWKGRWFVRVLAEQETAASRAAVMSIGMGMADSIPENVGLPPLLGLLPRDGRQPDSGAFFHTRVTLNQLFYLADENVLRLDADTDAALADYRLGDEEAKLLIVQYPDSERCLAAAASFREQYLEEAEVTGGGEAVVRPVEGGRFVGVMARPPYLVLVLDAPGQQAALKLLRLADKTVQGGAETEPQR